MSLPTELTNTEIEMVCGGQYGPCCVKETESGVTCTCIDRGSSSACSEHCNYVIQEDHHGEWKWHDEESGRSWSGGCYGGSYEASCKRI